MEREKDDEKTIKVLHVTEPTGGRTCPKCGGEGEKGGSWYYGPYYWECDDCGLQWGHV